MPAGPIIGVLGLRHRFVDDETPKTEREYKDIIVQINIEAMSKHATVCRRKILHRTRETHTHDASHHLTGMTAQRCVSVN